MNFHRSPHTFVGHVHLKVRDLKRSTAFYQEVIGFQALTQTEKTVSLTADGKTVLLTLEQPEQVVSRQGRTTGLYHFALLLPGRSDLAEIVQHFANLRVRIGSADHLVSEALYLSDPDGNGIEIYTDRDPSHWKWNQDEVEMAVDPLNFADLLSQEGNSSWKGLPGGTVMGHIHLQVSELQKTEEFYKKGLGFAVVNRYGSQALFVSTGDYHHHIGLNTWNSLGAPPSPANSAGLEFFTLVFPGEEARKTAVANLEKLGAPVAQENSFFVTSDPSGNRILLQVQGEGNTAK